MVSSIRYTQRHYQEKLDTKAEKLGAHWKLRDQNATAVNRIQIALMATFSKQICGHLF